MNVGESHTLAEKANQKCLHCLRPKTSIRNIISCLLDDVMESVINSSTAKNACEDLILNFEGPSEVKEK